MCRSFLKDQKRLVDHLLARGLKPEPDGTFTTPIAQDFKGRNSLRIVPSQWGYCNKNTHPVDMQATCPDWEQVKTSSEMAARIRSR